MADPVEGRADGNWIRVRIRFGKRGPLRFLGQLDVNRTLDRCLRRTGLPVRYSEGFNPRLRLSFPCAGPVGMESTCELLEIQVDGGTPVEEVLEAMRSDLPSDLPVFEAHRVPRGERLRLLRAGYDVLPAGDGKLPAADAAAAFLARTSVPAVRRGKEIDLRPFVEGLRPLEPAGLAMELRFLETGATIRPEDVLGAMGVSDGAVRVLRRGLAVELRVGGAAEERIYGA